jgi:multidrug efflux pump subunit AcrA (membrane-fusion protein)
MMLLVCGLAVGLVAPGARGQVTSSQNEAHIRYPACLVELIKSRDIPVPAQEAGVLMSLEVHEGMDVESGATLGQVDDNQVQMKKRVADAEYAVAKAEAENDVDIRFNKAKAGAAAMEFKAGEEANKLAAKAKTKVEMEELRLKWIQAWLGIEQAQVKQSTDKLKADARAAEVEAAENDIQRRKIVAPLSGEVIEVYAGPGEWLNPGASVVRIAQMDKLWVEGRLNIKEFGPDQISGRPVRVIAQVGPDRVEEFRGKVVFVDPQIEKGGIYRVKAEVVNRRAEGDGQWLLRPGMQPEEMVIDAGPSKLAQKK